MERKRKNTKQRILEESMKLFSVHGFEAVSIRAIADAVGVGNSALYKHYKNKQEILEAIVEYSKAYFLEKGCGQMREIESKEAFVYSCLEMFHFQTRDEWMVMFRRLLLIEQFKNPEMAKIYRDFFIDLPVISQMKIFETLMEKGYMKHKNARLLAMELFSPFFLYHTAPDMENVEEVLKEHVENFWEENFICR